MANNSASSPIAALLWMHCDNVILIHIAMQGCG